jgi:hypothetical protein
MPHYSTQIFHLRLASSYNASIRIAIVPFSSTSRFRIFSQCSNPTRPHLHNYKEYEACSFRCDECGHIVNCHELYILHCIHTVDQFVSNGTCHGSVWYVGQSPGPVKVKDEEMVKSYRAPQSPMVKGAVLTPSIPCCSIIGRPRATLRCGRR